MRWVADLGYLLAGLIYLPIALYHALVVGKNRHGWTQRLGFVRQFDDSKPRIWIHAVSLGEVNATPRLVEALKERLPEHEFVFSTTTDTGFARAVQFYGCENVFRFPLDFSLIVSRVLRRVQPRMIVLVELEVWYNLTRMATRRGVPVVVVNGRLTSRSARRLSRLGPFSRSMFGRLAWVGAQDETIAARFARVGARPDRIEITSSLKWDTATVTDRVEGATELARALGIQTHLGNRQTSSPRGLPQMGERDANRSLEGERSLGDESTLLWVSGSTGPGEEAIILEAYRMLRKQLGPPPLFQGSDSESKSTFQRETAVGSSDDHGQARSVATTRRTAACATPANPRTTRALRLAIVPRKPERFEEVALLIRRAGYSLVRRSDHTEGVLPDDVHVEVILGDTMGELRKFYSLASVVFVGRSLAPMGGSDPMEVAALGKPMISGPHMDNFESPTAALKDVGALRIVRSAEELAGAVASILQDEDNANAMGTRAQETVLRCQGATAKTANRIAGILET